ncbi:hypothetical protein D2T30_18780 [Sinirhodobacter populi]|uniref:Transposase IS116/IS110/IS902 C-terminal domain-containing protein n=1 Tax=Paenirhodobacter populi TaxID=2306993 RepID=A0A443JAD7_9RHOB|nr:hypothetical protein D2T30_18780 [Sinirhodobacter populi]
MKILHCAASITPTSQLQTTWSACFCTDALIRHMRRLLALRKPARKALTSSDYASGFLLEVWIPDEPTQALCRQVPRRVDITGALAMKAAIGDVTRFDEPQKLVSHLGLIRASGNHDRRLPATDGSPNWVADMLVEAAWAAARVPRPLRALFLWVRAGHGQHVAAIATARKPAVVIWHCSRRGRATPGRGPEGSRPRLQHQEAPGGRAPLVRAGRRRLCPLRGRLEPASSEEDTHGCCKLGATIEAARQGSHLGPCPSPAVFRAQYENSANPLKKLLSITSVIHGWLGLASLCSITFASQISARTTRSSHRPARRARLRNHARPNNSARRPDAVRTTAARRAGAAKCRGWTFRLRPRTVRPRSRTAHPGFPPAPIRQT